MRKLCLQLCVILANLRGTNLILCFLFDSFFHSIDCWVVSRMKYLLVMFINFLFFFLGLFMKVSFGAKFYGFFLP